MLSWFFGKSLEDHLHATKKVRINGLRFEIKKLNALNYIDGTNTIKQTFEVYKTKGDVQSVVSDKKVMEYFSEVLCGCVVHPKINHKKEDGGIWVQDMFVDWDLVVAIYNEIMTFTYGKKKNEKASVSRERLVDIDLLAKRYATAPSEFLKMSADELQFNLLVFSVGVKDEVKRQEKSKAQLQGRRRR